MGVCGAGTVGRAVIDWLRTPPAGAHDLTLSAVAARSASQERRDQLGDVPLLTDPGQIANDPSIQVVCELMGGEEPAYQVMMDSLARGAVVVTANKLVVARHWEALLDCATHSGGRLFISAAVGGGVPMIEVVRDSLRADAITSMTGILNATSNAILTGIARGQSYDEAVRDAQHKGLAEEDPSTDVSGLDGEHKARILSRCAFGAMPTVVERHGIGNIGGSALAVARRLHISIRPVSTITRRADDVWIRVGPHAMRNNHPLAPISGRHCALVIDSLMAGRTYIRGRGAGGAATASAVCADILRSIATPSIPGITERPITTPGTPTIERATPWIVATAPVGDRPFATKLLQDGGWDLAEEASAEGVWIAVANAHDDNRHRTSLANPPSLVIIPGLAS